jgi:hypothetical protein
VNDFGSLRSTVDRLGFGKPLPPVNAEDLKRVWRLIQQVAIDRPDARGAQGGASIHLRLITEQCEAGADVFAVFFRASILQHLLQKGLLDKWSDGNELGDSVFHAGASCPMEMGDLALDPEAFIERVRAWNMNRR